MKTRNGIVVATVLALGVASAALGFEHHKGDGPDGEFGHGNRLVQRLIFPCRAGCFDTSRTCFQTAASAAESCATSQCGSQITAARTACTPGQTSACETAVTTL